MLPPTFLVQAQVTSTKSVMQFRICGLVMFMLELLFGNWLVPRMFVTWGYYIRGGGVLFHTGVFRAIRV